MKKKTQRKKIRIGLDFDGVVAYNPFRIIRAPVACIKRNIFGIRTLRFFVPQSKWERIFWIIVHESSMFPAKGCGELVRLAQREDIELYLITARFSFLEHNLDRWLKRFHLHGVFRKILMNIHNEQPHEYKLRMIRSLRLDYFVEDNYDIVSYLQGKTKTTIYWVYNITDRNTHYSHKVPYLQKALQDIIRTIH